MAQRKMLFILALPLLLATVAWGPALAKDKLFTEEEVIWQITKPELVRAGEMVVTDEGTLVTGCTIQAKAKSKNNNVISEGTIVFNLSAFSPSRELPGQSPGTWYVRGNWEITKKNATLESTRTRHSSAKAKGFFKAGLDFNPLETQRNWSGLAWVPMSPAAGRWSVGDGSISLNGQFEGELVLLLNRLPETR